jgi:hypothetical protein
MMFKENVEVKAPHLSNRMTYSSASQGFHPPPPEKILPEFHLFGGWNDARITQKILLKTKLPPPDDDHKFHPFP